LHAIAQLTIDLTGKDNKINEIVSRGKSRSDAILQNNVVFSKRLYDVHVYLTLATRTVFDLFSSPLTDVDQISLNKLYIAILRKEFIQKDP
jgi:hypothetical protein